MFLFKILFFQKKPTKPDKNTQKCAFLIHLTLGTDADAASCTNAVGTAQGLPHFGSILELDRYLHVQSQY